MLRDNIDLNIWDKVGYYTEYKEEGWAITPYLINYHGANFGSGQELAGLEIKLTTREAKQLTLGLAKAEGGDYTPDEDFWIDAHAFYVVYRNIPRRVDNKLRTILREVCV